MPLASYPSMLHVEIEKKVGFAIDGMGTADGIYWCCRGGGRATRSRAAKVAGQEHGMRESSRRDRNL